MSASNTKIRQRVGRLGGRAGNFQPINHAWKDKNAAKPHITADAYDPATGRA